MLTGGSCVLLERAASLARPLLARQLISGSGAEDLLRSEGGRGEQGAGLVETRRDSSRAKSGHTRSRPTETFRHLHVRQRGGITAKMFRTYSNRRASSIKKRQVLTIQTMKIYMILKLCNCNNKTCICSQVFVWELPKLGGSLLPKSILTLVHFFQSGEVAHIGF